MKILLVEDNTDILNNLQCLLEKEGYIVVCAKTYKEARKIIYESNFDLFILDIMLNDGNGYDLYCKFIKELDKPTIFLTAKDDEESIVSCLESGAEDYITKPFLSRELILRIKKIVRRYANNNQIKIKDVIIDVDKMTIYKNDTEIKLTSLELKIFMLLINNLNKVVTREMIIEYIWDCTGNEVNDNTVTVYLKRIREKIGDNIIITLKGIGYRIDSDEK